MFELSVDRSAGASGFDVRVVLSGSLDREQRDFYQITVRPLLLSFALTQQRYT